MFEGIRLCSFRSVVVCYFVYIGAMWLYSEDKQKVPNFQAYRVTIYHLET